MGLGEAPAGAGAWARAGVAVRSGRARRRLPRAGQWAGRGQRESGMDMGISWPNGPRVAHDPPIFGFTRDGGNEQPAGIPP